MKDIGFTQEGNRLVEMSKEEYAQLCKLNAAVEGKSLLPVFHPDIDYSRSPDFDFTQTFDVILAWYVAKMKTNELQELLDDIKRSLNG